MTTDPIGETTQETARALLWRHGLPEDVIDGALALFAQELAGKIRARFDGSIIDDVREQDADLISPENWARTEPAAPAVSSPPPDQTELRDRIAAAIIESDGVPSYEFAAKLHRAAALREADAVLAVLSPPADQAALERVRAVLETEAVVGRSALEYRGLILSALMAAEAQSECSASISGRCLRESQSETACDTDAGECVGGGPGQGRPAEAQQQPDTETPADEVALLRLTLDAIEEGRRELRAENSRLRSQIWTLAAVFEGFGRLLASSSRDWGQYAADAWLYAVILGWDCEQPVHDETCTHGAMEEMAERHGWDAATVAKARRYRAVVHTLTAPAVPVQPAAADTDPDPWHDDPKANTQEADLDRPQDRP